jgi:putative FmdB family regulatory protein
MTYEYVCTACGIEWEAEQSISEPPLKDCPNGHANTAKRQVSGGAGFILKGGGWYADGYGSGSKKSESAAAKTTEPAGQAKADTKTETSTEKKADTGGGSTGGGSGASAAA